MKPKSKIIINRKNPDLWKDDTRKSVKHYNDWFLNFAPATYVSERRKAIAMVGKVIRATDYFHFTPQQLLDNPKIVSVLRMCTTPPIAKARLVGFSGIKPSLLDSMEEGKLPARMSQAETYSSMEQIIFVVDKLLDKELFPWLASNGKPDAKSLRVAECIIADRLCSTMSDPIIRNEQERRQLAVIENFLTLHGYERIDSKEIASVNDMRRGTFCFHYNVPITLSRLSVNMPIDVVVRRKDDAHGAFPLLVECKSAGDFTNTNKRRKEEAQKIEQLKATYGKDIDFVLFLCGYFDSGYLGYEAAEGLDWIWEHRVEDFIKAGI